ncbi:MAG: hypothetical protein K8T89_24535 [Planctomycetes bacterium]|nr:hypothetical protein [Planctomycetota bacterium]
MSHFCKRFLTLSLSLTIVWLSLNEAPLPAQPKAAPIAAAPQMPTITAPSISGGQRGKSVEISIPGTNLNEAVGLWTSFTAKSTLLAEKEAGKKDATQLRFKIDIPADAPIGVHQIRVATRAGVSNARSFCIDDLLEVAEIATNHTKAMAQPIAVPCVVSGRVEAEISDFFKISAKAGERLTFEVLARRLGSAFDPIILLHDAKSGLELPGLYNDDAPGLQADARLTHTFKEATECIVEVRDSTHRGGVDYSYRLRIGDFPAVISALPMAMKRGSKASITFTGSATEGVVPVPLSAPADPNQTVLYATPKGASGLPGWPVPVFLTDFEEILESEPNNDVAKANKLTVPGGVTARFLDKGDVDYFSFPAKKGTKYTILAETYEVNSPAEVFLILKNAKNADLVKSMPGTPSTRVEFTATEDGDLFIQAEHGNYAAGPNEVYHLTVKAAEPDFDVVLAVDRFEVVPGGMALIPVTGVVRRDYAGPIELVVTGPAGFSGNVTIPAGVPAATPPKDASPLFAYLPLIAKGDVPVGPYEIRVQSKAKVADKEIVRLARVTDVVKLGMAGLPIPPLEMTSSLVVGVSGPPLFKLEAKPPIPEVKAGPAVNFTIVATRATGFVDEIALSATALPTGITVAVKPIGKGTNDIILQVTAAPTAVGGPASFVVRGATKVGTKEYVYFSAPIAFNILADKKKEPEKPKEKEKAKK